MCYCTVGYNNNVYNAFTLLTHTNKYMDILDPIDALLIYKIITNRGCNEQNSPVKFAL